MHCRFPPNQGRTTLCCMYVAVCGSQLFCDTRNTHIFIYGGVNCSLSLLDVCIDQRHWFHWTVIWLHVSLVHATEKFKLFIFKRRFNIYIIMSLSIFENLSYHCKYKMRKLSKTGMVIDVSIWVHKIYLKDTKIMWHLLLCNPNFGNSLYKSSSEHKWVNPLLHIGHYSVRMAKISILK